MRFYSDIRHFGDVGMDRAFRIGADGKGVQDAQGEKLRNYYQHSVHYTGFCFLRDRLRDRARFLHDFLRERVGAK